jgi:hypothetical protein
MASASYFYRVPLAELKARLRGMLLARDAIPIHWHFCNGSYIPVDARPFEENQMEIGEVNRATSSVVKRHNVHLAATKTCGVLFPRPLKGTLRPFFSIT